MAAGHLHPETFQTLLPHDAHPTIPEADFSDPSHIFGMVKGSQLNPVSAFEESGPLDPKIRQPWTNVVHDDEFIEHLLSLYFTWQHSFFQNFPERLFRADMAAGRTKYCSSILVNAICAAGCFLSAREAVKKDLGGSKTLVAKFFDEAKRLFYVTEQSNITAAAALHLLSYVEGTRGRMSSLWMWSGASTLMAVDINLHLRRDSTRLESQEEEQERSNEDQTRLHCFWGCFHSDQTTAFTLGRLPNLNVNGVTVALPEVDEQVDKEPWQAYHSDIIHTPGAKSSTFAFCAKLSQIVNTTLLMFFAPTQPLSGALLLEQNTRYLDWWDDLPPILRSTDNAPPHVLTLQ